MNQPNRQKRVYGYTQKNNEGERYYGKTTDREKNYNKRDKKTKNTLQYFLVQLLKLIFKIIKLPFLAIFWLWQKKPKLKKETKKQLTKKIFFTLTALFIFFIISSTAVVAWISKDLPNPDKLTDRQIAQSTKIYDRTGEHLLYEVFDNEKRTLVELEDVPQVLVDAVIATEDKDFYHHKGIRPLSILRSVVYGLFTGKRVGSGASTLTQQLVKNAILSNEKTMTRKIKEMILTLRIEQKYNKQQILKIYFNEIPYGSSNYGIEAAAQSYFGKHVTDLTLSESAALAGLPQKPTVFLNNSEALKNRRNFVLRRTYEEGYISKEEMEKAQEEPLILKQKFDNISAPHFVLYIKEQLVNKYGEQLVDTGGLKVVTTIDWNLQKKAEKVIQEESDSILKDAEANNAALVTIDPKNGQILAMVGSKNFFDDEIDGQFNVVTLGRRQPGSSFKPIIYAAAFEKGYTPDTVLYDVSTNFAVSGKPYEPQDYDLKERGPISMRKALQGSLNIPAVQTFYLVGEKNGIDFAKKFGYTTFNNGNFGLSLVLGGGEVSMLEHTKAYTVFDNKGIKNETTSILSVKDADGETLEEWKSKKGEEIIKQDLAALMSSVLSDDDARAYMFGNNSLLTLPNRPVAVKTGTTNNYVDAWTVGYTPSLVTGVWAGNTDNKPMKKGYGGIVVASKLWNNFMKLALEGKPVENFPEPPPNTAEKPVLKGTADGSIILKIDKYTGKIATSSTPVEFVVEKTYLQPHSILHYVDKDDPRGPVPSQPEIDPQYNNWEAAIQDWIKRKKEKEPEWDISFEDPPTEYDDVHNLDMVPSLEIVSPSPSSTIYDRNINIFINASAPRGISKVAYKIDNKEIINLSLPPFNIQYFAELLEPGEHSLTAVVQDDIGNKMEKIIYFNLISEPAPPSVSWINSKSIIYNDEFPRPFALFPYKSKEIKKINLYYQKLGEGNKIFISSISEFNNKNNSQITFNWNSSPGIGVWQLIAEVENNSGVIGLPKMMIVEVK